MDDQEKIKTLEAEVVSLRREKTARESSKYISLNGKAVDVDKLTEFVSLKGLDLELADVTILDRNKQRVTTKEVKVKVDNKPMPFEDYITNHAATFKDWLTAGVSNGASNVSVDVRRQSSYKRI
jgi:hypothetical protein